MPGRTLPRVAAASLAACLFLGGSGLVAGEDVPPSLDADLAELAANAPEEIVSVWIVFAAQPAARIHDELRPEYDRLIASAETSARTALARIEPLLPPRDEREKLDVAALMALEKSLLTADEVTALDASRQETRRLVLALRADVLRRAQPLCDAEQEPVAAFVEAEAGGGVAARVTILNALIARLPASALPELARRFPGVERIERTRRHSVGLDTAVGTIGASSWTNNSYLGGGERVAVVDTGIDASHPAFTTASSTSVVVASTVQLASGAQNSDFADSASSTDDFHLHGTHCGGIVASNASGYAGVAPGTSLLNAKCFYLTTGGGGSGDDPDIVAATSWALGNGATVLSCSFGAGGTTNGADALTRFFDAAAEVSGVSVAIAAGNSGPGSGSLTTPGDGFNVVTVGAFDDNATTTRSDDSLASFSGRGPSSDGRRKPDLAAPGVNITSPYAHWEGGTTYLTISGTSMATPHTAGAMALLLSYNTSWQPESLKALLANTCRNTSPVSGAPGSSWGCGALDLARAYAGRTLTFTQTLTSTGATAHYHALGFVAGGDRATLSWNRSVAYAGGSPSGGGGAAKTLVNLDLALYDEADGSQVAASASGVDSLEQVRAASSVTRGVLVVRRAGGFPTGKTTQRYAVAADSAATLVNPPALTIPSTAASSDVAGGARFTFTATARNTGDLRAPSPSFTLTLPAGFSFASGYGATQSASTLDPYSLAGASATASWDVLAGSSGGTFTLSAAVASSGYGTTFTSSAATRSVKVDAAAPAANAGTDVSVYATTSAGRTVTLDASATTDDNAANGIAYAWDTDADGSFTDTPGSASGVSPAVSFPIGTRTVTLRATDYVGNTGTDTVVVTVLNDVPVARAGADRASVEGASVAFDGGASTDTEGPIAAYAWNFGDGGTAAVAAPAHVFRDEGAYTVTLTVTDAAGQTASDTALVTVTNLPPVAGAGPARSGGEGSPIVLAGSATDPGADDVLGYAWTFGDGSTGTGPTPAHAYADEGVYTATLTVSDGDGGTSVSATTVTVSNVAPVADAGPPIGSTEGQRVEFAGSATDAGSADVLAYAWTFGDGGTGTGAAPAHIYVDDGVYTATLTVSDGDGGTSVGTTLVTVVNAPPTASAGAAQFGNEGSAVSFSGAASDLGEADVLTYAWTFGDGEGGTGRTPSHVYADEGVYTATLTVTDDGGLSASSSAQVTIANVAPGADAGDGRSADEGATVTFDGYASDPGAGDVLTYAWTFGDGSTAGGASVTHVYPQDGVYTATLLVSDGDGGTGVSTALVTIRNAAPVPVAGEAAAVAENAAVQFHGTATDAGVHDTVRVAWDFGDGHAAEGADAVHAYAQDGVYDARFTATDDAGAAATAVRRITVANAAPELTLPDGLRVDVGDVFHFVISPTDASPVDAASLRIDWAVEDPSGAALALGTGVDVVWFADRRVAATLVVTLEDDDVAVERRAPLAAATPPLGDTFAVALAAGLDAATEKSLLAKLADAQRLAADPRRLAAAAKSVGAARALAAKAGIVSGPLAARLAALAADLGAGTAPPPEIPLALPASLGRLEEVIAVAVRAHLPQKQAAKLVASLLDLRHAKLAGSAKKQASAQRRSAAVALTLPGGDLATWLYNSIRAQ